MSKHTGGIRLQNILKITIAFPSPPMPLVSPGIHFKATPRRLSCLDRVICQISIFRSTLQKNKLSQNRPSQIRASLPKPLALYCQR